MPYRDSREEVVRRSEEMHAYDDSEASPPAVECDVSPRVEAPMQTARVSLHAMMFAIAAAASVAVFLCAARPRSHRSPTHAPRGILLAGNVTRATPHLATTGDRCTISLDIDVDDSCRLDVTCPTVERRFVAPRCVASDGAIRMLDDEIDLDGAHGRLAFWSAKDGSRVEMSLDFWH